METSPEDNRISEDELKFWNFAFDDLHRSLSRIPKNKRDEYFSKLYHENLDYHEIKDEILKASSYGHNIIIRGLAGSGKTSLVRRLILDEDFQSNKLYPMYVSTISNDKITGYSSNFIKNTIQYIKDVKYPIILPRKLQPENLTTPDEAKKSLNHLRSILDELDIPSKETNPIVFFDDLDYAEDEWEEITKLLRDFIADNNIAFVFTLRPRLEQIILSNSDDRIRYLYSNTEKAIMLIPNIFEIILNRIHLIVDNEIDTTPPPGMKRHFARLYNFFNGYKHRQRAENFKKYFKEIGIDNVDGLKKIRFPFHDSYLDFMKRVTGANLRRVFLIAKDTILYVRQHSDIDLVTNRDGTWEVNQDFLADRFMKNDDSLWNFLDINETRLNNDVSLYYAILHIIHHEPENEINVEKLYKIIKAKLNNAPKTEIKKSCKILSDKEWSLIDFIGTSNGDNNKYKLNKKGLYYLEIAKWPAYMSKYGNHNYNP